MRAYMFLFYALAANATPLYRYDISIAGVSTREGVLVPQAHLAPFSYSFTLDDPLPILELHDLYTYNLRLLPSFELHGTPLPGAQMHGASFVNGEGHAIFHIFFRADIGAAPNLLPDPDDPSRITFGYYILFGVIIDRPATFFYHAEILGQGFFPDTTPATVAVTAIPELASVGLLLIGFALLVLKKALSNLS